MDELFDRQGVALLGFDVVFAEPDESSGLAQMRKLAEGPLRNVQAYQDALKALAPEIDHDRRFAASLQGRPVVDVYKSQAYLLQWQFVQIVGGLLLLWIGVQLLGCLLYTSRCV